MVDELKITIICDNQKYHRNLTTAWGFACVIEGTEKTILFDTGPSQTMLLDNMARLDMDPQIIDVVVLSHLHKDHTGCLHNFLERNRDVRVYVPTAFPAKIKNTAKAYGAEIVEVADSTRICEDTYTTVETATFIKEQSLILHTGAGSIIVMGCGHPGILKIIGVKRVLDSTQLLTQNKVLLLLGGFHLEWAGRRKIRHVVQVVRQTGTAYVAPCHCTGKRAMAAFQQQFNDHYITVGAGKTITLRDLR